MDFVAVVDHVIALLRQRGRVTYSTLKRQCQLDEAALEHLPEHRARREQAIDLRFDLCNAHANLGQLGASCTISVQPKRWRKPWTIRAGSDRSPSIWRNTSELVGQYDRALASSQRALALATASGESRTPSRANNYLGLVYCIQGDYRQAMAACRRAIAALEGERRYARFGQPVLPAVQSRT